MDIELLEDNGTTSYELNVSDIEGQDINVTVESNNTAILKVTPNFTDWINQATWSDTANPLDFNLTTVENANGMVRITIIANDGELNTTRSFDVNVTAVNDAPVLTQPNNVVKAEDFTDFNVTLSATDVDDANLTYNALSKDTTKATVSVVGNILRISSLQNVNGVVTIDVNVTDGEHTDSKSFDFNITAVDDAPRLEALSDLTKAEDDNSFTIDLNATDVDDNNITFTVDSNNTNIATVSIVDGKLVVSPVANANGIVSVEVNATANGQTATQTFEVNIASVDDAPTLAAIANISSSEDADDLNITLNAADVDGHTITYIVTSSNPAIATAVVDANGKLVITQIADAYGVVNFEVNATANGQSAIRDFNLTVTSVNDAPTIDTTLANFSILEDNGTQNYDLNVSDIDGDELNVTITSSDSTILMVTPNWTNTLDQASWSQTLDYNLTTVADANGVVTITVRVTDINGESTTDSFDVNVAAVNDAPTFALSDMKIAYKNFADFNISLGAVDIDGDNLQYSASQSNEIVTLGFSNNSLTFKAIDGVYGSSDINVTVTDGNLSASKVLYFTVLPIDDGDDLERVGDIEYESDENSTKTTLNINNNTLSVQTQQDTNGSVSQKIVVAGKTISSQSDVNGSQVAFTPDGVSTRYSDANISLEVNATVTGEAKHILTTGGKTTKAISEKVGATTRVYRDINNLIEIITSIFLDDNATQVFVKAKADGSAEHRVTTPSATSLAISKVPGAFTFIKGTGVVQTEVGNTAPDVDGYVIRAVVVTNPDGTTYTQFERVNASDQNNRTVFARTLNISTPFSSGNNVTIQEVDGAMQIIIIAPLNDDIRL